MGYGFGPLDANATTVRPGASADSFGKQTWFKNSSGAGQKDGTVIGASWLNHITANAIHLCDMAGVTVENNQATDHFWYDAVLTIATQRAAAAVGALSHDTMEGFVAAEHVNHANVSVIAGAGLLGGGDLTATRTLQVDIAGLTLKANPATGDLFMLRDSADGLLKSVSIQSFLNYIFPQNKLDATVDPTADNDDGEGYAAGSTWLNTSTNEAFRLIDATTGAAVWAKTSLTADELGAMAFQDSSNVTITGGAISGVTIAGLEIGTDVQAYSANLDAWAALAPSAKQDALGFTPLDAASYTAADVLSKILTVDGPGSGLDADTLDGAQASSFQTALQLVSQGDAEAGTSTTAYKWSPLRVAQAIAALAGASFPSGTRMVFHQTAAPTGWTKDTTASLNNNALRIVTGSAASGGAVDFTTAFAATNTGAHTLTEAEIPAHDHSYDYRGTENVGSSGKSSELAGSNTTVSGTTGSKGGGGSHSHTLSLDVKYQDVIIATKD